MERVKEYAEKWKNEQSNTNDPEGGGGGQASLQSDQDLRCNYTGYKFENVMP